MLNRLLYLKVNIMEENRPAGGFITEDDVTYAGKHLLIDCYNCQNCPDIVAIEEMMITAAKATGATVLFSHMHPFEGGGSSGAVILAESHISVHFWSDEKFSAFDVFVCGNCDPTLAVPYIRDLFQPTKLETKLEKRGIV